MTNKIVDFFDKQYTGVADTNKFLARVKFYSLQRFLIRALANLVIPLYFRHTKDSKEARLLDVESKSPRTIVSLTTFPARIKKVWIVIESILRQEHKPDMIILWLSREYFHSIDSVPKKLSDLQSRGLQIRFVDDDIRSFKKYIYSLTEYPKDHIITVDDDIIYPTFIISKLIEYRDKYPGALVCNRSTQITAKGSQLHTYVNWIDCTQAESPSNTLFITTGGGTLIPPNSLYGDVLNKELFRELSFNNDDIWLNAMAQLKNTPIAKTDFWSACLPIMYLNNTRLSTINVDNGLNDRQLSQVRNYYMAKLGVDPFGKILDSPQLDN
jgi:hypothetical protein